MGISVAIGLIAILICSSCTMGNHLRACTNVHTTYGQESDSALDQVPELKVGKRNDASIKLKIMSICTGIDGIGQFAP